MEKNWVLIYTTRELYQAEIAKQLLEENGIQSVILNKRDSSYLTFGDTEVYVNRDNALRARNLIKSLFNE